MLDRWPDDAWDAQQEKNESRRWSVLQLYYCNPHHESRSYAFLRHPERRGPIIRTRDIQRRSEAEREGSTNRGRDAQRRLKAYKKECGRSHHSKNALNICDVRICVSAVGESAPPFIRNEDVDRNRNRATRKDGTAVMSVTEGEHISAVQCTDPFVMNGKDETWQTACTGFPKHLAPKHWQLRLIIKYDNLNIFVKSISYTQNLLLLVMNATSYQLLEYRDTKTCGHWFHVPRSFFFFLHVGAEERGQRISCLKSCNMSPMEVETRDQCWEPYVTHIRVVTAQELNSPIANTQVRCPVHVICTQMITKY